MMSKIGMLGIAAVLLFVALAPLSAASNTPQQTQNVWSRISLEKGNTTMLGGGNYIAIKSNGTFVGILYGSKDHPNSVKIVTKTIRYAGGVHIYDRNGNLKYSKVLRYESIVGQSFNYIWEFNDSNNNGSFDAQIMNVNGTLGEREDIVLKGADLHGVWNLDKIQITNISSNETKIDFTVYRDNIPYSTVYNDTYMGDGVVNRIAFHFHITVKVEHVNVTGFPWYAYRPMRGVSLQERKNYSGDAVIFQIKYDKDIQGWDHAPNSKLAVGNNIFFGIAGNDKVVRMVMHRFGGCHARIGNHEYGNNTAPPRRFFRHGGKVIFTEVADWQRVGKFVWESNVTVDGANKTAYYQIKGGEKIFRWLDDRAVALVVFNGLLIYPSGNQVFQDPLLEVNQLDINFNERTIIPTGMIAAIGLAVVSIIAAGVFFYTRRKS